MLVRFIFFLLITTSHFAEGQSVAFQKIYSSTIPSGLYSISLTFDSGYVFAGTIGIGTKAPCLLKTDQFGDLIWSKRFDIGFDAASNIYLMQTPDSGFILSGYGSFWNTTGYYVFLIKTNVLGDTIWTRYFPQISGVGINAIQISDGGYLSAGSIEDTLTLEDDPTLTKFDMSGNIVWSKAFNVQGDQNASSVNQTMDGGYILFGYADSSGSNFYDAFVIKTDSNGITEWSKRYGLYGRNDWAEWGQQTRDGGYIILMETQTNGNETDACLIKTDSIGSVVWSKKYGGALAEFIRFIQQTNDKGYVFIGVSNSFSPDSIWQMYLVKVDSIGDMIWSKTYDGDIPGSFGDQVRQFHDDGYVLVGSFFTGACIIKTDSLGNSGCNESTVYTPSTSLTPFSIAEYPLDSVLYPASLFLPLTISNQGSITTLCSTVGIANELNDATLNVRLFPNPFHTTATISTAFNAANAHLRIYNVMGVLVREEKIEQLSTYTLHRGNLTDGFYFYELTNNQKRVASGKFVIE